MANDFITPSLVARTALATLYNTTVLLPLVWRDFDPDFTGKQGDTVNVRKPAVFEGKEFNRVVGIEIQSADEDSVPIQLDVIADVSFEVTSEEATLEIDNFAERLLDPAMEAISQKVDGDLAEALVDAAEGAGGGGTSTMTSVASDVFTGASGARSKLGRAKIPTMDRHAVFSPEGAGVALSDTLFVQADKSGSTDALREGSLGRVFGFATYESQVFGFGSGDRGQADGVAFYRQAVTIASRRLDTPRGVGNEQVAVEDYKGLGLRVVYDYDINKKKDVCSVDILYGIEKLRPAGAVQLSLGIGS